MNSQQFCYWDAKSLEDAIIIAFLAVVTIIMGFTAAKRLSNMKKFGEHGRSIIVVFVLIILWAVLLIYQNCYSLFIFFIKLEPLDDQSADSYSRQYVRFDILPGFLVQTVFLQICRFYYQGLANSIEMSRLSKWQQRFITYLNFYFVLRIFNQIVGIVLLNIFAETNQVSFYSTINIWILICDSLIGNIFLGFSLSIYSRRFAQIDQLGSGQLRQLRKQYTVMIVTSIMRVIIDVLFLTGLPLQMIYQEKFQCIGPFDEHLAQSLLYQVLGNFVNHLLPMGWILKIYNLSSQNLQSIGSSGSQRTNLIASIGSFHDIS